MRCIIVALIAMILTIFCIKWSPLHFNDNPQVCQKDCIQYGNKENAIIKSMGNSFKVHYVENSSEACSNPGFPNIRVEIQKQHNAWLHIIHTDSKDPQKQVFIDSIDQETYPMIYPFFTYDKEFIDGPFSDYTLLSKPMTFWKGHVYPVQVNWNEQSIEFMGGIEWGFELSYLKLKPHMIKPRALTPEEIANDWEVFNKTLKDYKMIFTEK